MNLQVITHNTGQTEVLEDYRTPNEKSLYRFMCKYRTRTEYQVNFVDKVYRVLNKRELNKLVKECTQ